MADFYSEVLLQLRHATAAEKEAIRAELSEHVADHADALMEAGYTREEAEARALEAMGDPKEIGQALAKKYTRLWLVVSRVVNVCLVLAVLMTLSLLPFARIYHMTENLKARNDPASSNFAPAEKLENYIVQDLDLRAEIGNDILRVYRLALDRESGKARVYMCNYDRSIFGQASQLLLDRVRITTPEGKRDGGGGGGGNAGAYYWRANIEVQPGDDFLTVHYDHFGEQVSLEIPLDWGRS